MQRFSKTIEYDIPEGRIGFGISPEQEMEALAAIDYYKDAQMDNFDSKSTEYVEYCHKMINKIQDFIRRNTYD